MAIEQKAKKFISLLAVLLILFSTLFTYYTPIYALFSNAPQKPATPFLGGISMGQFICMPSNTFDIQSNFKACLILFSINIGCIVDKPRIGYFAFCDEKLGAKVFDSLEITLNTKKGDGKK